MTSCPAADLLAGLSRAASKDERTAGIRSPRKHHGAPARVATTAAELFGAGGELLDRRLLVSAMGLPRVCRVRKCRRRRRCFGLGFPCLDDHPDLAAKRFAAAMQTMGWKKDKE